MKYTTLLLVLVLLCLALCAEGRGERRVNKRKPRSVWRQKRDNGVAGSQCNVFACASEGGECGLRSSSTLYAQVACQNGFACNLTETQYPNDDGYYDKGMCIHAPVVNQECDTFDSCYGELSCYNGTCHVIPEYVNPGGACDDNAQCYFNNGTLTNETADEFSLCDNGECYYRKDNTSCDTNQCNYDLSYCLNGFCTPITAPNQACEIGVIDPCKDTYFCAPSQPNGTTGTCKYIGLQAAGQPCVETRDCLEGHICGEPADTNATFGICMPYNTNTSTWGQPCTTDLDCTTSNGEFCACDYNNVNSTLLCRGENVGPTGFNQVEANYEMCREQHAVGCTVATLGVNETCLLANCRAEACAYYALIPADANCNRAFTNTCNSTSSSPSPSPAPSSTTSSSRSSSSTLQIFSGVFALFVAAIVL